MKRDVFREGIYDESIRPRHEHHAYAQENTLIELRKPEIGRSQRHVGLWLAHCSVALAWAAIITLAMGVWRWLA